MKFEPGHKFAKGGKREGAGRKSAAELKAKESRLEVWERKLTEWDERHATRFCEQALVDNTVLLSARRAVVPDAKQQVELSGGFKIVKIDAWHPDD